MKIVFLLVLSVCLCISSQTVSIQKDQQLIEDIYRQDDQLLNFRASIPFSSKNTIQEKDQNIKDESKDINLEQQQKQVNESLNKQQKKTIEGVNKFKPRLLLDQNQNFLNNTITQNSNLNLNPVYNTLNQNQNNNSQNQNVTSNYINGSLINTANQSISSASSFESQNCIVSNCKKCTHYKQVVSEFKIDFAVIDLTLTPQDFFQYQICNACQQGYYMYRHKKVQQILFSPEFKNGDITSLSRIISHVIEAQQACISKDQKVLQTTVEIVEGTLYMYYQYPDKYKSWAVKMMQKYNISQQQIKVSFVKKGSIVFQFWFKVLKDYVISGDVLDDVYDPSIMGDMSGQTISNFQITQVVTNNTSINQPNSFNNDSIINQDTNNNKDITPIIIQPIPQSKSGIIDKLPIIIAGSLSAILLIVAAIFMFIRMSRKQKKQKQQNENQQKPNQVQNSNKPQDQNEMVRQNIVPPKSVSQSSTKDNQSKKKIEEKSQKNKKNQQQNQQKVSQKEQKQQTSILGKKQIEKQIKNITTQKSTIKQKSFNLFGKWQKSVIKPPSAQLPKSRLDLQQIQSMQELVKSNIETNKPLNRRNQFL